MTESANLLTVAAPFLPDWVTTKYHYTPYGVDQVTDPKGNIETTQYDTLGRVTQKYSPDAGTTTNIQYDGFDELLSSMHLESGATTTYNYDVLGREIGWSSQDGNTSATFTYDLAAHGLGKLASTLSSDQIETEHTYDQHGRATTIQEMVDRVIYTTSQKYDSAGRLTEEDYPSSSTVPGLSLHYHYTPSEYLKELDYQMGGLPVVAAPLYTIMSRAVDDALVSAISGTQPQGIQAVGSGVTETYSYLPATGQLQHMTAMPNVLTTLLLPLAAQDLSYAYYPNGTVKSKLDTVNGRLESYSYDSLSRLTSWSLATCSAPPCTPGTRERPTVLNYGYDDTGNLVQVSQASAILNQPANVMETNNYGGINIGPHALSQQTLTGTPAMNYGYDSHGRQTSGNQRKQVTYNAYDLPTSVQTAAGTTTFRYDAFGQRVKKSGPDGTSTLIDRQLRAAHDACGS